MTDIMKKVEVNLLGKAGVAVPLIPMLPSGVQNTIPLILVVEPMRPPIRPPNWAFATIELAIIIATTLMETKIRLILMAILAFVQITKENWCSLIFALINQREGCWSPLHFRLIYRGRTILYEDWLEEIVWSEFKVEMRPLLS